MGEPLLATGSRTKTRFTQGLVVPLEFNGSVMPFSEPRRFREYGGVGGYILNNNPDSVHSPPLS